MTAPPTALAKTVMLYRAMPDELDLGNLASAAMAAGKRLVYPRCVSKTELEALCPTDDTAWTRGHFGISEPDPDRSVSVPPEEIDLVVCPCAAFDETLARLGMGAGYYDRFLPRCSSAFIASAAFECQKRLSLPMEAWDVPMRCVFTEKAEYRSGGAQDY